MAKRRRKSKPAAMAKARQERKPDPDGYYLWLIGTGFTPENAMRMVDAKFGGKQDGSDRPIGWAWKG